MDVLVVDIGGTRVKLGLPARANLSGPPGDQADRLTVERFRSGCLLTPDLLMEELKRRTADWRYDVVSIGYPGAVVDGKPAAEPGNLADGWVGYDFAAALGRPVRLVNDAILHALGAYRAGRMLYLGLGTGVASALVSEHVLIPLELGSLPHTRGGTVADHLGRAARKAHGHDAWHADVLEILPPLRDAFTADYVVLGGGNGRKVDPLPACTYRGERNDAFTGGVRLWEEYVEPHDAQPARVWRVLR